MKQIKSFIIRSDQVNPFDKELETVYIHINSFKQMEYTQFREYATKFKTYNDAYRVMCQIKTEMICEIREVYLLQSEFKDL